METYARVPDPLIKGKDGNMTSNWQNWKEDFISFMKVTGYIYESNETRANLLKNRIGKVGIEAIQNLSFDNIYDKDDMDILIEKLDEYFNPPKNEVVERYHFFTRVKKPNESIEQYINTLKEKGKTCNFNDMLDSIIRDKIILETHDKILRKRFFEVHNLDLPKLIAIYHDYDIIMEKMKQFTKKTKAESAFPSFTFTRSKSLENLDFKPFVKRVCWRCGQQHPLKQCPAKGSKCTKCGDVNHFTHRCKNFKSKMHDNKVNKNLLDPVQQAKLIPENNDKWNNQADSIVETTDSVKVIFPDIPTTNLSYNNIPTTNISYNIPTTSLSYNNIPTTNISYNIPTTSLSYNNISTTNLSYNNTNTENTNTENTNTNHSARLLENREYNYSKLKAFFSGKN